MKALILAAGNGTRLRPLTDRVPKCLLPIRGIPLLEIWLELCARHGIDEVFVNTHTNSAAIRKFAASYSGPISINLYEEEHLLGSAGTLYALRDNFKDEPYFWVMYGDVLTTVNLDRMLDFHRRMAQVATLGLYEVANPRQCGIVSLDSRGLVREFTEKPADPQSNLAFSGIMLASPQVLKEIPPKLAPDIGFDLLPRLINRMAGYRISEYLVDIGTLPSYEQAQFGWPGFALFATECQDVLLEQPC